MTDPTRTTHLVHQGHLARVGHTPCGAKEDGRGKVARHARAQCSGAHHKDGVHPEIRRRGVELLHERCHVHYTATERREGGGDGDGTLPDVKK